MKTQLVTDIVFNLATLVLFISGFYEVKYVHSHTIFIILGGEICLCFIAWILGKRTRNFYKTIKSLPADHRLVTQNVSAIDIGNYRLYYHVYVKGNSLKSFVSFEVSIPFPPRTQDNDKTRVYIDRDLQQLIDELKAEGTLTDSVPVVQKSDNQKGELFLIEFRMKAINLTLLSSVQNRIMSIIDKYKLQDMSWCVITGENYGTNYSYYKGNLLQNTVLVKDAFSLERSDFKDVAPLYYSEYDGPYSVDDYLALYNLAQKNLGKDNLRVKDIWKLAKQRFKGSKRKLSRIAEDKDRITVSIRVPKPIAASTYHLIHTDGLWWIFAEGLLENIDPLSTADEASACDMFLRILYRHAG